MKEINSRNQREGGRASLFTGSHRIFFNNLDAKTYGYFYGTCNHILRASWCGAETQAVKREGDAIQQEY